MKRPVRLVLSCLVSLLLSLALGRAVRAQPAAGEWTATAGFGTFTFTVNAAGTQITGVSITLDSWHCGGATRSGTITTTGGWAIANNAFAVTIRLNADPFNPEDMRIEGKFNAAGTAASGTWTGESNGASCSGTWTGTAPGGGGGGGGDEPVTLRYFDPQDDAHLFILDRVAPIDSGFVMGTNFYEDRAKAVAFALPVGKTAADLGEVRLWFGYKRNGLSSQTYAIEIFAGTPTSGPTGAPLFRKSYRLADVNADADPQTVEGPTVHAVDPAVAVGATFFVSVDFGAYGEADWSSAGLWSGDFASRRTPEVWEKWSDGTWSNVSDAWFQDGDEGWYPWIEATVQTAAATNHPPAAPAMSSPAAGAALMIGGGTGQAPIAPETPFVAVWTGVTDQDGDTVTYRWQLATRDDFASGSLLVDEDTGSSTAYTTTLGTLAAVLDARGIALGSTLAVWHRAVASDGFASTPGSAVPLTLVRGTLVGHEDEPVLPSRYVLYPAYPNPARSAATLAFDLPVAGAVRFEVYDLLGRKVHAVDVGTLPAGRHAIELDMAGLPDGLYVVRLMTAAGSRTTTLVRAGSSPASD